MRDQKHMYLLAVITAMLLGGAAQADFTPTIDGSAADWPSDPDSVFLFHDGVDQPWYLAHRDIVEVRATDDNTSGTDGNLYLLIELAGNFIESILGADIDFTLNLDTNGDGVTDTSIELTEAVEAAGGDAVAVGNILEVAIPYSVLGLSYGNDTIGISVTTTGWLNTEDDGPNEDSAQDGYVVYDGTSGSGEPVAVRMLTRWASLEGRDRGVQIGWTTGAEWHNAGFRVYRKAAGGQWQLLTATLIAGMGDTAYGRTYSFYDPAGTSSTRYRIEDVDFGGSTVVHSVPRVQSNAVYPEGVSAWYDPGVGGVPTQMGGASVKDRIASLFWSASSKGKRPVRGGIGIPVEVDVPGLQFVPNGELSALGNGPVSRRMILDDGARVSTIRTRDGLYFVSDAPVTRYADSRVYTAAVGRPRWMPRARVAPQGCANPVTHHLSRQTFEENNIYRLSAPSEAPFFWVLGYAGTPITVTLDLGDVPDAEAAMDVALSGYISIPGLDHTAEFVVNGVNLGVAKWSGVSSTPVRLEIPAGVLVSGANELVVNVVDGAVADFLYLDDVSVSLSAPLVASPDGLVFEGPVSTCIQVDGLVPGSRYELFDISDPAKPIRLVRYERQAGPDSDRLQFQYMPKVARFLPDQDARYLLSSLDDAQRPVLQEPVARHSFLKSRRNRADYLVITHPLFYEAAVQLASHHREAGLEAMVVTTDDVYTAFTGGNKAPVAIRELLQLAAKRWRVKPRYVVLMGAATVDPGGFMGEGDEDYLPAPFFTTLMENYEAAADGWYVKDLPGVSIGRLAVESPAEADAVVAKIIGWQGASSDRSLFIADNDDLGLPAGEGAFELPAERQIAIVETVAGAAERLYRNSTFDAVAAFEAAVNDGVDLVSYNGHAYLSGWSADPQLTNVPGALALQNEQLFILASWSCYDGAFTGPWDDSLAWAFVRNPSGGAIASISGSSMFQPVAVEDLSAEFFYQLASGLASTLGEALYNAKAQVRANRGIAGADAAAAFNLLGDPATPNPWL